MNFRSFNTSPLQKILYMAGACLACILLNYLVFKVKQPVQVSLDNTSPRFSASRAFDTTREFVTQHPKRLFGSLESRQSTGYLTDRLTAMGYEVEYINFDGRIGGGQQAGRNVLAYKQGETDEIIVVTAHFDTARPTVQGAAKNGAAVGVLMELAGVFSKENTRRSLLFVFTDGGEWGATGAKDLAANYEKKDRIAAVLTLDYVTPGDLAGFRLDTIGQLEGFSTPAGILKMAEDAVNEQAPSIPVEPEGLGLLEKAFMISRSEQGPFLRMGISAINLGSFSKDRKREKTILHSSEDTVENLKIETIDKYGRVAEQIVRSLAESPEIPGASIKAEGMMSLTIFMTGMCILIPTSMSIFRETIKNPQKTLNLAQAGRELLAFFAVWIPFLVLFLGIRLAYAARQFPFYDLYPAIAKDPAMQNPPWKVFIIIAVGVLFAAIAVWIIARYFLKEWVKPDYQNSCAVLCCVPAAMAFLSAFYNPFWGLVFFVAPLVLWPMPQAWKSAKPGIGKKIFYTAYIAAAAVPACAAFWWLAARLGFGWNFFWYQALALTTGLFSPAAYFMGTAVIAVGIRLIVITLRRDNDMDGTCGQISGQNNGQFVS